MFKATDFKLMRRNCSEELNELLRLLKIPALSFDDGDEFEIYSDLDKAIDEKFCAKLNCKSDLDGYAKLLNFGGIACIVLSNEPNVVVAGVCIVLGIAAIAFGMSKQKSRRRNNLQTSCRGRKSKVFCRF